MEINELESLVPIGDEANTLASEILKEDNLEHLKNLTNLFNLNQAKKNVIRVLKLNELLDKVQDQMLERFAKRPGEFSNDDLISYMQVTQQAIDRANKSLKLVDETPAIQVTNVNINTDKENVLSRESREKIDNVIKALISKLNLPESPTEIIVEGEENEQQDN